MAYASRSAGLALLLVACSPFDYHLATDGPPSGDAPVLSDAPAGDGPTTPPDAPPDASCVGDACSGCAANVLGNPSFDLSPLCMAMTIPSWQIQASAGWQGIGGRPYQSNVTGCDAPGYGCEVLNPLYSGPGCLAIFGSAAATAIAVLASTASTNAPKTTAALRLRLLM